jgi:anti-sigma regulatory factor (Ser/Thr protein kinase)
MTFDSYNYNISIVITNVIGAKMENQADDIKEYLLNNVEANPREIVLLAMKKFNVTRTTVHRHLNYLIKNDKIEKSGKTNTTRYFLKSSFNKQLSYKINLQLSEADIWLEEFNTQALKLKPNVQEICYYGFTEIVNNAKDHSEGTIVDIVSEIKDNIFIITIADNGIGIFKKIKDAFNLSDERESILQLSKGKLTTAKEHHSGEGIFFTSRAFDSFSIMANGLFYMRDNSQEDWFIEEGKKSENKSTVVKLQINLNSTRIIREVFKEFENPETSAFDRTYIVVKLSLSKEDYFVSRSQAKRILTGIEKFNYVTLDFKDIKSVGQAFVDEVFRVFKNRYPEIQITTINTNDNIDFMIKRGIATANL